MLNVDQLPDPLDSGIAVIYKPNYTFVLTSENVDFNEPHGLY